MEITGFIGTNGAGKATALWTVLGLIPDFMSNGSKGVFFSTHITSDLDKIADMIVMIDQGRILLQ